MSAMTFTAPPTVASFMQSAAFVRIIMGPVGSGKSTGCLIELFRRMAEQAPAHDGIRHTRFAIVRQTLQQITQTVLKEFYTWVLPVTNFKISEKTIYIKFGDIESEIHLIPLEDELDQRRLLSMQLTGVWVNEFPEIDPNLIPSITGRLGRYPSKAMGGPTWFGLIMDGNFPTEGGEWHNLMEIERPGNWDVYKQPGGLTPEAENLENLPGGREYYTRLADGQKSLNWVKRYVHAEYGDDPSGSAVFKESFRPRTSDNRPWHVVSEEDTPDGGLIPVFGHPILVGMDFGRDPCAVITQMDHLGRLLVLDEVINADIGLQLALDTTIMPLLRSDRYMNRMLALTGDPAGNQRSTIYEETTFDFVKRRTGLTMLPAPTNDIDRRLQAVESFLLQSRAAGAAILIDKKRCPILCRALGGGYRYVKTKTGQTKPTPDKNKYSHVVDALEYACLCAHNGMTGMMLSRLTRARRSRPTGPRMGAGGWT
jgi:hypothetical protein